jgi:hypothetical protein
MVRTDFGGDDGAGPRDDFVLVRYNRDGSLDRSFGGGQGIGDDRALSRYVAATVALIVLATAAARGGGGTGFRGAAAVVTLRSGRCRAVPPR